MGYLAWKDRLHAFFKRNDMLGVFALAQATGFVLIAATYPGSLIEIFDAATTWRVMLVGVALSALLGCAAAVVLGLGQVAAYQAAKALMPFRVRSKWFGL